MNLTLPPDIATSLKNISSFQRRFNSIFTPKTHQERVAGIAKSLANFLKKNIPASPAEARWSPIAKTVRSFRKDFGAQVIDSHQMRRLTRMEFAFLLAINPKALKDPCNKGFLSYVQKSRIDCAIAAFGHRLQVNSSGEILILHQNKYVRWKEISTHAELLIKKNHQLPSIPWPYGEEGLMKEHTDLYHWERPKPLRRFETTPPWGRKNFIDICIHAPKPDFVDNHTWFHLRTSDGQIFGFSKYRYPNLKTLAVIPGKKMSPDYSVKYVGYVFVVYAIEITEDQKNKTFEEQLKKKPLTFQNLEDNCTNYVLDVLESIGIEPPQCKVNVWRHILPISVTDSADTLSKKAAPYVPAIAKKGMNFCMTAISNSIMLTFNPFGYNKQVTNKGYFATWKDIFTKPPLITSPWFLANRVLPNDPRFTELDSTKILLPECYISRESNSSHCPPPWPPTLSHSTTRTGGCDDC